MHLNDLALMGIGLYGIVPGLDAAAAAAVGSREEISAQKLFQAA